MVAAVKATATHYYHCHQCQCSLCNETAVDVSYHHCQWCDRAGYSVCGDCELVVAEVVCYLCGQTNK